MQTQHEIRNLRWKAERLTEVRAMPSNPWRGMYAIYPFMITGEEKEEPFPILNPAHSLCLVELNLYPFRETALSPDALKEIDRILAWFRQQKRQQILRFLYDWDGNGLQNEPQSIKVILTHMEQLSPLFARYADCIFTLQGLFVGSWGEMHGSRHLGAQSLITLTKALDEAAEGKLLLAVRCPSQWREIFQSYDPPLEERVFDGQRHSRVGLFNDAILASDTDYGTYGQANRAQAANYGTKLSRAEELAFQNRLCTGVPNGGELVQGDGNFSLQDTYRAFRLMHLTYLNDEFDTKALDRLRNQSNIARGRLWRKANAYEYLTEHLGYRYRVGKVRIKHVDTGIQILLLLENTGFASCYFPLETSVLVQSENGQTALQCPIAADSRRWQPGKKNWLTAKMQTFGLPEGTYSVVLCLRDPRCGKPVYLSTAVRGAIVKETLPLGTLRLRGRLGSAISGRL